MVAACAAVAQELSNITPNWIKLFIIHYYKRFSECGIYLYLLRDETQQCDLKIMSDLYSAESRIVCRDSPTCTSCIFFACYPTFIYPLIIPHCRPFNIDSLLGSLTSQHQLTFMGGDSPLSNWRVHLLKGLVRTAVSVHLQRFGE
jgi:hypothetical protein